MTLIKVRSSEEDDLQGTIAPPEQHKGDPSCQIIYQNER